MSADVGAVLPRLGHLEPAHRFEADVSLSGLWFDDLCLWLGRPLADPGTIAWPMILIPELIDTRLRLADDTVQVYQRIRWDGPVSAGLLHLESAPEWVSERGGSAELAITTWASRDSHELARSLLVVRRSAAASPWGSRRLPPVPEPGPLRRKVSFVVSEAQVQDFGNLYGGWHGGLTYPGRRPPSYDTDSVLPGHLLLLSALHYVSAPRCRAVEMWFRRPVSAGSALAYSEDTSQPGVAVFQLIASSETVAVLRFS